MIRLKLILFLTLLSSIQCAIIILVNGEVIGDDPWDGIPCTDENKPVCSATKTNLRGRGTEYQTFQNECKLNEHNSKYGNKLYLANYGPCNGGDCPKCSDKVAPVCHSMGYGLNNNKAFRNKCYVDRYICLHGYDSVSFIVGEEGKRCKICQRKGHFDHPKDPQWEAYIKNNVAWQTITTGCVDDMSDLIAE